MLKYYECQKTATTCSRLSRTGFKDLNQLFVPPRRFTFVNTSTDSGRAIPVCDESHRWILRDLRAPAEALRDFFVPNAISGRSEAYLLVDFIRAHARVGGSRQHNVQPHRGRQYRDTLHGKLYWDKTHVVLFLPE